MHDVQPMKIGRFTVTPLVDGTFPCGPDLVPASASPAGEAAFRAAGLPPGGPSVEPFNAFAVDDGERFCLVDAGLGEGKGLEVGHLLPALQALGRGPRDVDAIVLTHMHADHIGGLLDAKGGRRFPEATVFVSEAELAFWSDPAAPARCPHEPRASFDVADAVLSVYGRAIVGVPGDAELAPGFRLVPLPGHSPGHCGFLVEDGGRKLLMWGDVLHCAALQFAHPHWGFKFDMDPGAAIATRSALLAELAEADTLVAGSHMSGCGTVRRDGHGYTLRRADHLGPRSPATAETMALEPQRRARGTAAPSL